MSDQFKDEIRSRMGGIPDSYIEEQSDSLRVSDGSECVLNREGRLVVTEAAVWLFDVGEYITHFGSVPLHQLPQDEPEFGSLPDDQRSEAKNIGRRVLRDNGWVRVGSGSVREVWEPPEGHVHIDDPTGCLVKIARWSKRDYDGGVEQNRMEISNWIVGTSEERKALTPPSEYNARRHRWFTVPRVDTNVPRSEAEKFTDRLESDGWSLLDSKLDNIGTFGGETVFIDSGIIYPPDSRNLSDKKNELKSEDPGNTLHEVLEL